MTTLLSAQEFSSLFRFEYDRINESVYDGALPSFPGVRVGRGVHQYGCCQSIRESDGSYRLVRFHITRYLTRPEDLLDTIWHEIAHAAAIVLDRHTGHGAPWRRHAARCGARMDRATVHLAVSSPARPPVAVARCARGCGWSREYVREGEVVRSPKRYLCAQCRGPIIVERRGAT